MRNGLETFNDIDLMVGVGVYGTINMFRNFRSDLPPIRYLELVIFGIGLIATGTGIYDVDNEVS